MDAYYVYIVLLALNCGALVLWDALKYPRGAIKEEIAPTC